MESVRTHIKIIGWINIIFSLLYILGGILAFAGFFTFGNLLEDDLAEGIFDISGSVLGIILLVLGLPGLVGGAGLLKYQDWARILIIILSVFGLFNFPLGTIFSVYSLWILFRSDTRRLFEGYTTTAD